MSRNHTGGITHKLQVSIQPNIGLDGDARRSVVGILNTFLADEAILTTKTYSACWNIHGAGFLELRTLFNQQGRQLRKLTNKVAERLRILGGFVISSFGEFLRYTRLNEQPGEAPDIISLLADHEAAIRYLREDARKCYEEYEDYGTFALFVHSIRLHEKMAWMLRSYIEPEMIPDENQGEQVRPSQR